MSSMQEIVNPCTALVIRLRVTLDDHPRRGTYNQDRYTYLGLGHLVVVVRESEVDPTGVYVHVLSEDRRSHDGALDMPSWATGSPRGRPSGFSRFGRLP